MLARIGSKLILYLYFLFIRSLNTKFKQETLTSGNWCKIDGKPDGQGNCQEAVADGGYMGNGATIYEHEVHGCNNPNISDCNTLVVETNCTDSTFIRNTIQLQ